MPKIEWTLVGDDTFEIEEIIKVEYSQQETATSTVEERKLPTFGCEGEDELEHKNAEGDRASEMREEEAGSEVDEKVEEEEENLESIFGDEKKAPITLQRYQLEKRWHRS